ncbi:MAG: GldM family protein [Sediminibacterium sp.]
MSLPKEPRQKMINIMYLVLTALLALNVSAEILNAFKIVDGSLNSASGIADKKTADIFKSFERKKDDPKTREKAEQWLPKAQQAQKLAQTAYQYIENLKKELKQEADLKVVEGKEEYKEDDLEAATRLFISRPPEGKNKGKELFDVLNNFRNELMKIDTGIAKEVVPNLPIDLRDFKTGKIPTTAEEKEAWAYNYFHMTPTIASVVILSKFQNDIKNSEAQVVEYCHKEIGEVEIIYDEFAALANSNSQYLMPGEELVITAGVGAFSKAARPTVTIDGANVALKPDGSAEYKTTIGGNAGAFTKKVRISFTKPDGTTGFQEKEIKYTVGVPSGLVVSTDKTRVFYQGLQNELSVNGGSGDEKNSVTVEGPGVRLEKKGSGLYYIFCENLGIATVNASDGKRTQKISIPIKPVPLPLAKVGNSAGGGSMGANQFRVQKGVVADLKDFVFEGVKYDVVSFTIVCTGKGFEESGFGYAEVAGAYFNADAQALMKRLQPGSTVIIDEIKVKGPGGIRKLDQNISFTLQ